VHHRQRKPRSIKLGIPFNPAGPVCHLAPLFERHPHRTEQLRVTFAPHRSWILETTPSRSQATLAEMIFGDNLRNGSHKDSHKMKPAADAGGTNPASGV